MAIDIGVGTLTEPITGRQWGRAEVLRQVATRVRTYQSRGFTSGNRVLILFGNRLEFFAELLAVWRLGGCAIPVDSRLTPFEIEKLAAAADARFCIIDDKSDTAGLANVSDAVVLNTLEQDDDFSDTLVEGVNPQLDDDALILFTSGSTGQPKGVVHTYRSLYARWITLRQSLGLEAYRRTLCVLPTHFGHGLICNCLFPWLSGCDLFITPPFRSDLIMRLGELIDEHRISFVSSVPSMWSLALKTASPPKKGSLLRVHIGSAPLSMSMWEQVQQWSGVRDVFNAYGITETGSWVAGTTGCEVVPESGLIGEPWGSTIRVLNLHSTENVITADHECAAGEPGMIWLNTPALMKGYFQRQDLTDGVISQGWFMTGDIGVIDERGYLYLRGRERDEINKGGMKVYPSDIDEIVEQHAATQDVCTFGMEDELYGENVAIAVVMTDQSAAALGDLHTWMESRLARHKMPVRWYLLDEIPRTSRGKINRDAVMQSCMSKTPLDLQSVLRGINHG
jgi:acyl-CoA synthetase (AMP-forming)/AMP-acid ligase II